MNEYTLKFDTISMDQIAASGQQFTWQRIHDNEYAVADGKAFAQITRLEASRSSQTLLIRSNEDKAYWKQYFDYCCDYAGIWLTIMQEMNDSDLKSCYVDSWGIRILQQDPWQTLCGFVISQNNNIPRIKKTMATIQGSMGEKIVYDGTEYFTFPDPEDLAAANDTQLRSFGLGYRSEYIHEAAAAVMEGRLDLARLPDLGYTQAKQELKKIKGIGDKVADCVCLFGAGYHEAFPIDVWIHRIIEKHYPQGFDIQPLEDAAGVVQQFMFEHERHEGK